MTTHVLIVDDQALVRAGFRMIVDAREDLEVVGEAADGEEAVRLAAELHPDVVLMDIRMPNVDGIEATQRILAEERAVKPRILVLTTFDLDEYVYRALRAGASGFLLKDTPPEALVRAISEVVAGDGLLAPSVTRRLIERFTLSPPPGQAVDSELDERFADLTPRETEVLRLLVRGLSNAEIAAHLFVSDTTVKSHVGRLLMKLGVGDRVQAVVLAYETGFVTPGQPPAR
jgi:DNA-binding NarL/FixJ family response regulator